MSFSLAVWLLVFIAALMLRVPIALGMLMSSVLYFIIEGVDLGTVIETTVLGFESQFVLLAVPLFIFTARVMNSGGITGRIFDFAGSMVGGFRGGLAHVNVAASIIFSGMTGSAIADASGLGMMEVKAMNDAGYDKPFSCAVTAASATIGPIIPPSIPVIIYAMLSGASVGNLFLGGIIPGLLMGISMMGVIYVLAKKRGYAAGASTDLGGFLKAFKRAFLSLLTPVILLGGIYGGIFTPTEAAAVAALYALVLLIFVYRNFGVKELVSSIKDTVESTGFLAFIIACAFVFGYVIAREQVPAHMAEALLGITTNKWVLLLLFNLLFLVLGCFVDTIVLLLIVVPIVLPVARAAGIDLVHFGIVIVLNMMIGLITPPFGMLLFIVSGLTDTPLSRIIKEMVPFLFILIAVLFLCTYVPGIVMFLPRLVGY
ncbi:MAG: TRAP transporter large permease [Nitrospirota bacterium]|nr:MAG: TRAP transporter large permease [Nitrospirota bacterium]